jgi:hypothetical protein
MCQFFSFVTCADKRPGERFYFDWRQRQEMITRGEDGADSHDHIIATYKLNPNECNCYEYNPLLKTFEVDQQNSSIDDRTQAEEWVRGLDFKRIVELLILKPIVNPLDLQAPEVDAAIIDLLKQWASVRDSVRDLVGASVGDSVRDSVEDSVWDSVWASAGTGVLAAVEAAVGASVGAAVWASVETAVRAYESTYFALLPDHNLVWCIALLDLGFVPSYDGTIWRLHAGKDAKIVYEWRKE